MITFEEETLDDLLITTYQHLLKYGEKNIASRGETFEFTNVSLVLNNPRARVSLSETRSTLISAVGEFFWYLSGSNAIEFIEYYIKDYRKFIGISEGDSLLINGAYGPRLFGNEFSAVNQIINLLSDKPSSRQAVMPIYGIEDLKRTRTDSKDIPCTCLLQFFIRKDKLSLTVYMRSNDASKGLVHDIFSFTLLQEIILIRLRQRSNKFADLRLGTYTHIVGSLHLYEDDTTDIKNYIEREGWHGHVSMYSINEKHLDSDLAQAKYIEEQLRLGNTVSVDELFKLKDIFWFEIACILYIWNSIKYNKLDINNDFELLKTYKDDSGKEISKVVLTFLLKRAEAYQSI